MESPLTFLCSQGEFLAHNVERAVIRHLQVVDTSHDARQIVIRCVWRLAGFAHHGEHGRKTLEACSKVSTRISDA